MKHFNGCEWKGFKRIRLDEIVDMKVIFIPEGFSYANFTLKRKKMKHFNGCEWKGFKRVRSNKIVDMDKLFISGA